jgi:hypothetical protein
MMANVALENNLEIEQFRPFSEVRLSPGRQQPRWSAAFMPLRVGFT